MKKIIFILLTCLFLASCSQPKYEIRKNTTTQAGFDTLITFMADTTSQTEFDRYFELLKSEYTRLHKLFDIYNSYPEINNLKTINDNAGIKPVQVDQAIIDMLLLTKNNYELTHRKFDATMGAVLKIWHQYREEGMNQNSLNLPGQLPAIELLQEAKKHSGWNLVEIDEQNKTVYITDPQASLDIGGIAKGFATELVAQALEAAGCQFAAISAGGNVRTINHKHDQTPWIIGIQKPSLTSFDSVDAFKLEHTGSMVTSGDYQRFYQDETNKRYHHLIDPDTLFPSFHYRSVTVFVKDSGLADYLSTVLFLIDFNQATQFIETWNQTHSLDEKIGAYWIVDESNELFKHPDFKPILDGEFKAYMTPDVQSISKSHDQN